VQRGLQCELIIRQMAKGAATMRPYDEQTPAHILKIIGCSREGLDDELD
jgi:hypothetical protein